MKVLFKDLVLLEIYQTGTTKDKRYKSLCKSKKFVDGYTRVIKTMYSVDSTNELKLFSFLHYEKLKYQESPLSSVRIANGMVERLLFTENNGGIEIELIEINSTHYGNKK
jgi:plasmid maintenance system killer protein